MMEAINAQNELLPVWVQIWMNWMIVIFMVSVFFVKNHKEARYALAAMILTVPTVLGLFALFGKVHLFGVSHFLWWLPLAIYIVKQWRNPENSKYRTLNPYSVWVSLLMTTISISILFDVRDVFLVAVGVK